MVSPVSNAILPEEQKTPRTKINPLDKSGNIITMPEESKTNFKKMSKSRSALKTITVNPIKTIVLARSELLVQMDTHDEIICHSEEPKDGIFIANSLLQPCNNKTHLVIMNVTEHDVALENYVPNVQFFNQYNNNYCEKIYKNDKRIKTIKENITLPKELNKEELDSIHKICEDYNDLFHLPNDEFSNTNVVSHKIPLVQDSSPSILG